MRILLAAGAAIALASSAQAITVVNGSFEQGVAIGDGGTVTLATGDATSLNGWTILADGIDYVDNTLWAASVGSRSVDLSALSVGGISQRVFGFVTGQRYRLKVDVSANPFDPALRPYDKRLLISTSGALPEVFAYQITDANTVANMLYQTYFYDFTAIGASQLVQLRSLVPNQYGVVIDNVRISEVPEATTWGMMLAGFGMVGFAFRSRRYAKAVSA
jgi:hypothetical protein